jgi:WD40 repeat protein
VQSVYGSISVIDAPSKSVVRVFDDPNPSVADGTASMTLSPDGSVLYAIARDGAIAVVDTGTGAVTARIPGNATTASSSLIRISHDGQRLFVFSGTGTISAIDATTGAGIGQVSIPSAGIYDQLTGFAVSADDRTLYAVEYYGNLISIDTASMAVTSTIPIGRYPYAVDLSPDGSHAIVAETGDSCVSSVDLASQITTGTGIGGNSCFAVAAGRDGRHVYLGSYDVASNAYSVVAFDTTDGSVVTIPGFSYVNFDSQSFSGGGSSVTPEPGTWWNPAESGRSFNIEVRHGTLVLVAQVYDSSGAPTWLLASGPYDPTSGTFSGEFGTYSGGQCLGCTYRAPDFSPVNGGQVRVVFSTVTSGMLYFGDTSTPIQKFDW